MLCPAASGRSGRYKLGPMTWQHSWRRRTSGTPPSCRPVCALLLPCCWWGVLCCCPALLRDAVAPLLALISTQKTLCLLALQAVRQHEEERGRAAAEELARQQALLVSGP